MHRAGTAAAVVAAGRVYPEAGVEGGTPSAGASPVATPAALVSHSFSVSSSAHESTNQVVLTPGGASGQPSAWRPVQSTANAQHAFTRFVW
jgi:hypothetical protein